MAIVVFLSTVSDEFRAYRDQLVHDLTRQNVAVKVQEDFKDLGGTMLDKLDAYIAHCDAVVHLVGGMCGFSADKTQQRALTAKHSDLQTKLPPLGEALGNGLCLPFTQWEAWLALYHGKSLMIAKAAAAAPRGPRYAPTDASRKAQADHLARLKTFHRYPGNEFGSPDELAKQIAYSVILDLLVEDYAKRFVQQRDVAEGFIREMAKRVAGDKALDFDGMKQQVQKAIEIYETEIAGRPIETNIDAAVDAALARAKEQVDRGRSDLARATLRRAAEEMRREEEERRERFEAGVTALYTQARDIALAAYDGDAAAEAIVDLARSIHGANAAKIAEFLGLEAQALYEQGRDHGSNVHLVATIALRRELLVLAKSDDARGAARNNLGIVLGTLGERESGTARLEEAVVAFRAALEERTRERVPLEWAATQSNLGVALQTLGAREGGTARLEQSVAAYHAALQEQTRDRVPLDWATTQNNLGNAHQSLGLRESGTEHLHQAVEIYRAALQEQTRDRVPLDWATTQNNLGNALKVLGQREAGTARLEEAVRAYCAALEVWARERVPLAWADTQIALGSALIMLGQREGGTDKLEQAVEAYHWALEERTRERGPLHWAAAQAGLGNALKALGDRESGTARLEQAVGAYEAALQEQTPERVPLQWAVTQNDLGNALRRLAERENSTARLEQAVEAYRTALQELTRERLPLLWARAQMNLGTALADLGTRGAGVDWLKQAVGACLAALQELTRERVPLEWAMTQNSLGNALRVLGERENGTVRLAEAVAAYYAALEEHTRERVPLDWAAAYGNQGIAMILIADRTNDSALAEAAVQQIEAAHETLREGGHQQGVAFYDAQLPKARAIRDRHKGK
ncbi:MAG TPA: tetratricopeptide repeat protein [Roseiarcus sp.]|jgi:tetratricopeptide (TPR) repeat protein|nr:tetratricopeptide repeat protein [Roseiarcus sp.]